jgi:uncharacterized protein (UPF0332 family)
VTSTDQLMNFAAQDLDNAQLLLANGRYRASISRAYYAMYYCTQALLDARKIASRSHKGMIQQFGQHFVKSGDFPQDMARELKESFDLRHLSDYETAVVINREQAENALAASIKFVEQVRHYLGEIAEE